MSLVSRFQGDRGSQLLLEAIAPMKLVGGNLELASLIQARLALIEVPAGAPLIEQNDSDNDMYLILSGSAEVVVNGRRVGLRGAGDHVGEMAAIQPSQARSATISAIEDMVVGRITEEDFAHLARQYPEMYKSIAIELSRRLLQRNRTVGEYRDRIRVFIISSVESLTIARSIQEAFEHDPFHVVVWTDGVFKITNYTLQSLEDELDKSDFAIAIAHSDDVVDSREVQWPTPRDNVIFELGLFMGRLGRSRAILMEPREDKLKLPSDLSGITSITYSTKGSDNISSALAPACNKLRRHINELGANNG